MYINIYFYKDFHREFKEKNLLVTFLIMLIANRIILFNFCIFLIPSISLSFLSILMHTFYRSVNVLSINLDILAKYMLNIDQGQVSHFLRNEKHEDNSMIQIRLSRDEQERKTKYSHSEIRQSHLDPGG